MEEKTGRKSGKGYYPLNGHIKGIAIVFKNVAIIAFLLAFLASNLPSSTLQTRAAGEAPMQETFTVELAEQLALIYDQKQALTPPQRKIDTAVLDAVRTASAWAAASPASERPRFSDLSTPLLKSDDAGNIEIELTATGINSEKMRQLEANGMKVVRTLPEYGIVEGSVPYGQVENIAGLDFVKGITTPSYPWYHTGAVNSEGDAATRAAEARTSFGVSGSGQKVGVMSDGVSHLANVVATGDLPASPAVDVLKAGSGDEGTAMLEIIHDLAPQAPLAFYGPTSSTDMVNGIRALKNAGSKIIVDDITFLNEPKFEDGPIALEARAFYDSGGVYVTSAGNSAQRHYSGNYTRKAGPVSAPRGSYPYYHNYNPAGSDMGNSLYISDGDSLTTVFQWNNRWGYANDDFDIFLIASINSTAYIVASSTFVQDGNDAPYESLTWTNNRGAEVYAYIMVLEYRLASDPASMVLDYTVYSGPDMQYIVPEGSVVGHEAVSEVLSTATSNAATPDTIAPYSSRGPGKVYFPSYEERQTPNITGIDGVSNKTGQLGYFSSPFYGTSAAAPHLAAIAALVWQAKPTLTSSGVRSAILNTALDRSTTGWDTTWGFGRVDAYQAVASVMSTAPSVSTGNATNITTNSATVSGNLTSLGTATSANVSFQYGTGLGNYTFATTPVSMNTTGAFSANLTGLLSGTIYYFRAKAVGDGTSYGVEKSFATLSPVAPTVTTVTATNIAASAASLNGTLNSLGTVASVSVSFQWGLSSGNYTYETTPVSMNTTGAFSANLTSLSANTTYYFRAKAVGDGTSYGVEKSFNTLSPMAPTEWNKTFGGVGADSASSVQQTTDGGYIMVGYTTSFGAGSYDVYLIKTDASGNMTWSKTFGGASEDEGYSVKQTVDDGYIITGYTTSFGAGYYDVYLIKTDASGNMTWSKTFGGVGADAASSTQQTGDGGYIIAGSTYSFGAGNGDVYLIKTDASGSMTWGKTFGGASGDGASSTQQTVDGGYIIAGSTQSFGAGSYDVYLIKTDASGNMTWSKTFGGVGDDIAYSVQQTVDGGYIITGYTYSFGAGVPDVYLIKTDALGNMTWSRTLGGTNQDYGEAVQQTADGGYIITGYTYSFGAGSSDVYLIKVDALGNITWSKTFGGARSDRGNSAQQTVDGGYIIGGGTDSFGAGNGDVFLIKIASPAPTVTTNNATNVYGTSARLNGTLTSLGTALSANVSFQWGLNSSNYTTETTPILMSNTGAFSANLTGLSNNTTYYFRTKAVGEGIAYGNELGFTTTTDEAIEITLKAGWNMVSLPVVPANLYYKSVFPTALVVYSWNPVSKSYATVANLEAGKGYWVAVSADTVATVVGSPVMSWTSSITAGWNMIGSVNAAVGITNPEDTPDNSVQKFTYWWNPVTKSYLYGTAIEAGKGYWVAAVNNCSLTLSATSK